MGTSAGAAARDSDRLAAGRAWVRRGMAAAVPGMLAWITAVALIPPDAKLDNGEQHLAQVLRAHTGQLDAAALLAVLGAVLLAAFVAVLTRLVPAGSPGRGLLRVSLAGSVITQTMVAADVSSGLAGLHATAGNAGAGLAAVGWRGLWLSFLASAVPTILWTVTGALGLRQAGCPRRGCPPWAGCRRQRTCWCCPRWPSAARSRRTGSSPGSSRSPPSSGSSPWPPPCRDRSEQPSPPPWNRRVTKGTEGRTVT